MKSLRSRASNAVALAKMIEENSKKAAPVEGDAATVATSAIDAISIVPPQSDAASVHPSVAPSQHESIVPSQAATEVLQEEYKKLLDEYESIAKENHEMELEVAKLRAKES